jgi:hypothetical protein
LLLLRPEEIRCMVRTLGMPFCRLKARYGGTSAACLSTGRHRAPLPSCRNRRRA